MASSHTFWSIAVVAINCSPSPDINSPRPKSSSLDQSSGEIGGPILAFDYTASCKVVESEPRCLRPLASPAANVVVGGVHDGVTRVGEGGDLCTTDKVPCTSLYLDLSNRLWCVGQDDRRAYRVSVSTDNGRTWGVSMPLPQWQGSRSTVATRDGLSVLEESSGALWSIKYRPSELITKMDDPLEFRGWKRSRLFSNNLECIVSRQSASELDPDAGVVSSLHCRTQGAGWESRSVVPITHGVWADDLWLGLRERTRELLWTKPETLNWKAVDLPAGVRFIFLDQMGSSRDAIHAVVALPDVRGSTVVRIQGSPPVMEPIGDYQLGAAWLSAQGGRLVVSGTNGVHVRHGISWKQVVPPCSALPR